MHFVANAADDPSENDMKKFMNKAIDEMAAEIIGQGE